jgi:RecB family exonuclease
MTYLDRPAPRKGPPWAHNSLGASVHNALAGWWRLPRQQRTAGAAGHLLERGWLTDGYSDGEQSARCLRLAMDMVERYVAGLDPDQEPVGVERTVGTKTDRIAISGRIDRLDDRPANAGPLPGRSRELVVVDYKTGRRPLTADDARSSLALAVYAIAAGRVLHRPCLAVELHHLPTGQVIRAEHTGESLDRQLGRAEDIAAECALADQAFGAGRSGAQQFPPRTGPGCGWCDFRAHCPQGQAAAPARRPDEGLAVADGDG